VVAQKAQFGQLKSAFGPLQSLTFTGEKVEGDLVTRRNVATFENEKVQLIVSIDGKGIVAALGLRPM
ncbi:hypothetical protein, partial [Pseudomonas sp. GP01-A4]|uniref:hypothetical protein n=1 Tax=Pseudomonas sp. GP01-A4 TaxID=2070571 RepID=UPI000CC09BA7